MGSVGGGFSKVDRMDISKLSKSQQEVMEWAYKVVDFTRSHTLEEWSLAAVIGQRYQDEDIDINKYRPVSHWQDYGYPSKEYIIERTLQDAQDFATNYKRHYENAKNGIVLNQSSSSTIRALEKRGFIKIIEDRGRGIDVIQIIENKRKRGKK